MPTPDPVAALRSAKAAIDAATRSVAQAEALAESSRHTLQLAVEQVAAHIPIAGKSHDQLVADLDTAIADADRQLATCINATAAAVEAFTAAKAGVA